MENDKAQRKILLIGGGGHCHSVLDSILASENNLQIGVIARDQDNMKNLKQDLSLADLVIGTDSDLPVLFKEGWQEAFISLGSVGNTIGRKKLYEVLKNIGFNLPMIKDPTAIISAQAKISSGVFIGKNVVVNAGSVVGDCAIINTGAIVEHDCHIGAFAHVSPGTIICGQAIIGNDAHIGAGSVVRQCISIGSNALIGAGSVVVKDIPNNVKAYGNPCKVVD